MITTTLEKAKGFLKSITTRVYDPEKRDELADLVENNTIRLTDIGFDVILSRMLLKFGSDKAAVPYLGATIYQYDGSAKVARNLVKRFPNRPFIAILEDIIQAMMPSTLLITRLGSNNQGRYDFVYDDQGILDYGDSQVIVSE